jgi:hypothetical protein
MSALYKSASSRNLLYALSVGPPAIFLATGHVALGLVFLLCVVGARFSRPPRLRPQRNDADPINS